MIAAILVVVGMAAVFGLLLGYAAIRFKVEGNPLAQKIDAILPQTQCGQCGFVGCHPYAEAMAKGEADINRCPPGGEAVIKALAELLGVEAKPLDADSGEHTDMPLVAIIDENTCIGCTLCIQACPVDAIVGSAKHMHTIIASECTGCKLCLPPCPVDCIAMVPINVEPTNWKWPYPVFNLKVNP
jgi:electron transport complex protein RnfB